VQRQHLYNCKLQYLHNSTAQESVKDFHRIVVMAPCRLPCPCATPAHPATCALPVLNHSPGDAYTRCPRPTAVTCGRVLPVDQCCVGRLSVVHQDAATCKPICPPRTSRTHSHNPLNLTVFLFIEQNALRADYDSWSTYSMVSPLHPGHPSLGIPP